MAAMPMSLFYDFFIKCTLSVREMICFNNKKEQVFVKCFNAQYSEVVKILELEPSKSFDWGEFHIGNFCFLTLFAKRKPGLPPLLVPLVKLESTEQWSHEQISWLFKSNIHLISLK